jgi:hypothetical protein
MTEALERETVEQVISAWAFAHNIDGSVRNDLFKRLREPRHEPPAPADEVERELVSKDDAQLALFQAIEAIKLGNPTDDKLILANLRRLGFWLVRACSSCGGFPIREVLDGEALCQSCCDKWARSEGAA